MQSTSKKLSDEVLNIIKSCKNREALEIKLTEDSLAEALVIKIFQAQQDIERIAQVTENCMGTISEAAQQKQVINNARQTKASHKRVVRKLSKEALSKEKRQFDSLSEADKMAYLEQEFRALQIFDSLNYDLTTKNIAKIKQGSVISIPGLVKSANGGLHEVKSNVQITLNRIPENSTQQITTSDRLVNQIKESFAKITLADREIPIDDQVSSIIGAGKVVLKVPGEKAEQQLLNFELI